MLLISLGIFMAVTLTSEAPDLEDRRNLTWAMETWREESRELEEKPAWKNYRLAAGESSW